MSEKYSTDRLADELETIVTEANCSEQFRFSKLNKSIADAIVARLRAGDKLCEAAKEQREYGTSTHALDKAIANYEDAGGKP